MENITGNNPVITRDNISTFIQVRSDYRATKKKRGAAPTERCAGTGCPGLENIGFHVFEETVLDSSETTVPVGMVFDEDGGSSVEEEVRERRTLFAAKCKYCGEMMLEESVQNYDLSTLLEDRILTGDIQNIELDTP